MLRGYYSLASHMLTQSRDLNVISNNMANASTTGYKRDSLVSYSFRDELISRTGNMGGRTPTELNTVSMLKTAQGIATSFKQGPIEVTGRKYDFAITSNGFFQIETPNNGMVYTKNGSFTLDDQGNLYLQNVGRVMGKNGQPIFLDTDNFTVDSAGNIFKEGNVLAGTLQSVSFNDYTQLSKVGEGMFENPNANNAIVENNATIMWKSLEGSNVNEMEEMTSMMSDQRALQSASQIIKMYDQLMSKAVTELGRL